jgi:hypothetical protein
VTYNWSMSATGLFKRAVAIWTKVPGLPFTIPGTITQHERLPGMSDWAPRDVITRVSERMQQGDDPNDIVESEQGKGLGKSLAIGSAAGGISGGLLGRLVSGEEAVAPIKEIFEHGTGTSLRGLRNLSKIPRAAQALTLGGLGLGALAGGLTWGKDSTRRGETAGDAIRGLDREHLNLQNAQLQNRVLQQQLLTHNPMPSATAAQPLVAQTGKAT